MRESTSERAEEIDCFDVRDANERMELDLDETDRADWAGDWLGDGLGNRNPTWLIV